MPIDLKLHKIQNHILDKLAKATSQRFNELLVDGMESEHMNYHLKKLIDLGFVTKTENQYALTNLGKDYVNLLDDETGVVERQPKIVVVLFGVRENTETGEIEYLLNRRLEQPYLGKVGRIGGKVRFGETFEQAARRELFEETGLEVKNLTLEALYRKMRNQAEGEFIQDVVFMIYFATEFSGTLIEKTSFQENFWASKRELLANPDKYDLFDDLVLPERLTPAEFTIEENINIARGF